MFDFLIAFMIYSYLGATLEHLSYSLFKSKISKPKALANAIITGFPLYGSGAFLIVYLNNYLTNVTLPIKFLIFSFILSSLEYIAGVYTGAGKTSYENGMVKAWDYSDEKYNIDGKISLRHFISWGILGLLVTQIHPKIMSKIRC